MSPSSQVILDEILRELCWLGDQERVEAFLNKGANPNVPNAATGMTCLHWAVKQGHKEIVRILIEKGADKEIPRYDDELLPMQLTDDEEIKSLLSDRRSDSDVTPSSHTEEDSDIIVFRVMCPDDAESFIEVEAPKNTLTWATLVTRLSEELDIDENKIQKIRKYPNHTLIRNDRDVSRLKHGQDLEVILIPK